MYECKKCGKQFEGNFCPECGEPRSTQSLCPKCGQAYEQGQRFCRFCGCNLMETKTEQIVQPSQTPQQTQQQTLQDDGDSAKANLSPKRKKSPEELEKLHKKVRIVLDYVPMALSFVFLILYFVAMFSTASTANDNNIFLSAFEYIGVRSMAIFTAGVILFTGLLAYVGFTIFFTIQNLSDRDRENSTDGKINWKKMLRTTADFTTQIGYCVEILVVLVLGIVSCALISSAEYQGEYVYPSTGPILITVISAIFLALTVCSLVAMRLLDKKYPQFASTQRKSKYQLKITSYNNILEPTVVEKKPKSALVKLVGLNVLQSVALCIICIAFIGLILVVTSFSMDKSVPVYISVASILFVTIISVLTWLFAPPTTTYSVKEQLMAFTYGLNMPAIAPILLLGGGIYYLSKLRSKILYSDVTAEITLLIVLGIVFVVTAVIMLVCNAVKYKKIKKTFYGKTKIKLYDRFDTPKDNVVDHDAEAYWNYRYQRAEYDWQTKRKVRGAPFRQPSSVSMWYNVNKTKVIIASIILFVVILTSCIVIPAKDFEIKTLALSRIDIGESAYSVARTLGAPTVGADEPISSQWEYYDRETSKKYDRLNEIEKQMSKLEEAGKTDSKLYSNLIEEALNLTAELMTIVYYETIIVYFDENQEVTSVIYKKVTVDNMFGESNADDELKYERRQFNFELTREVGDSDLYEINTVKTYYEDGTYTLVQIPSKAFDAIDYKTAGTYTLSWYDPIVGTQQVEIIVE